MNSPFDLTGKTALVTGAATGIGQAIAWALATAGADIVLIGHQRSLEDTEKGLPVGHHQMSAYADFADLESLSKVIDPMLEQHRIDIMVNNAGSIHRKPVADYGPSDWDRVLTTNLTSVFFLTQHVARTMIGRRQGKIIHIASLLSFQGGVSVPAYTASKHGVVGITKAMANEWAQFGVQVNAIAPGYIETNNTHALRTDSNRSKAIVERIPSGRWGRPEDIAPAAVFLASAGSDYINGHTLVVDGGWMAR